LVICRHDFVAIKSHKAGRISIGDSPGYSRSLSRQPLPRSPKFRAETGLNRALPGRKLRRKAIPRMTRQQVLDLYFMEARAKLIDLAAFLDRLERATGDADFRHQALLDALGELQKPGAGRARNVLLALSDPTTDPIEKAHVKGAVGAWPGRP
jgi:hypothetical protein